MRQQICQTVNLAWEFRLVVPVAGIGAPTISFEKPDGLEEGLRAVRAVEKSNGRRIYGVMTDEIGGANAMEPMVVGAVSDLPVVDVDAMGRAFPETQMNTFSIYGVRPTPCALTDEKGNVVVFTEAASPAWLEKMARSLTTTMGCTATLAFAPVRGDQLRAFGIQHSISQSWHIGNAILEARRAKVDPIRAILACENGKLLFRGKVRDLHRSTSGGFAHGHLQLAGFGRDADSEMHIAFQNENLIARRNDRVVAAVPDLITILETETGRPISTEEMRYGLRVAVLGLPCSPLLCTRRALAVVGPAAFGYQVTYEPLGDYAVPTPVTGNIEKQG